MAFSVTVTPGETFPAGEPITLDKLRRAALPTVSVEGSVGALDLGPGACNPTVTAVAPYFYGLATFATPVYSLTLSPAPAALANGLVARFKIPNASDGAVKLNLNSLDPKPLVDNAGNDFGAGDLVSGQIVEVVYNSTLVAGGCWQVTCLLGLDKLGYYDPTGAGDGNAFEVAVPGTPTLDDLDGVPIRFRAEADNTGPATLTVNALAATDIRKFNGTALAAGDIRNGQMVTVVYSTTATVFLMIGSLGNPEIFTGLDTGAADVYVVAPDPAPKAYADGIRVLFKVKAYGTNTTATPTLDVNSLGAATIVVAGSGVVPIGALKAGAWIEVVYNGANWQLVNQVGRVIVSAEQTLWDGGAFQYANCVIAHTLAAAPNYVRAVLVCKTADGDYAEGDEIDVTCIWSSNGVAYLNPVVYANATSIGVAFYTQSAGNLYAVSPTDHGTNLLSLSANKWALKFYYGIL